MGQIRAEDTATDKASRHIHGISCRRGSAPIPLRRVGWKLSIQRLPLWLQRNSRPIRPYSFPTHPDQSREQGRLCKHLTRTRICGFHLWIAVTALFLRKLYQLSSKH